MFHFTRTIITIVATLVAIKFMQGHIEAILHAIEAQLTSALTP